jgi:hypothetical protein
MALKLRAQLLKLHGPTKEELREEEDDSQSLPDNTSEEGGGKRARQKAFVCSNFLLRSPFSLRFIPPTLFLSSNLPDRIPKYPQCREQPLPQGPTPRILQPTLPPPRQRSTLETSGLYLQARDEEARETLYFQQQCLLRESYFWFEHEGIRKRREEAGGIRKRTLGRRLLS